MQTISIGELQKNVGMLSHLTDTLVVRDKRKNKNVATIIPIQDETSSPSVVDELAGAFSKYAHNVDNTKSFKEIKEEAMMMAMKEKYGFPD